MYVSVMHFHLNITHIQKNIITFFNQNLTHNQHKSVYLVNKVKLQSLKFPTSNYFNINLLAIHITCSYVTTIKSLAKKSLMENPHSEYIPCGAVGGGGDHDEGLLITVSPGATW